MNLENSEHTRFPPVMVDDPRIARAIRFLERTPAYSMQLTDVANHMDLSPFHLQRIFKSTMGETPAAYLRRTRLDRAAMNLQMSSEPITAIALNAGYQSHEAFIRAFHLQFGTTPSDYRSAAQLQLLPASPGPSAVTADVAIDDLDARNLLALRFYGPHTEFIGHWRMFGAYLSKLGIVDKNLTAVSIVYDTPLITPALYLRHDCAIIDPGLQLSDTALQPLLFRAGRYVSIRHRGSYDDVLKTYATVSIDWLKSSGEMFLPDGNGGYEIYRRPPWQDGHELDFDIVLPLV
ncbi:helix-turn-helix domain-containing protein [Pseudorhizobium pelagicum]|uniref:helix-turn-helix domain-containing protein n=1 Tax=Pseudorhizobium pelagicum TaxID=1509405 RepID=UPI001FDA2F08|nr:helix-turn-helix domain-containing protein [Pseudorhizobium pelagicum]